MYCNTRLATLQVNICVNRNNAMVGNIIGLVGNVCVFALKLIELKNLPLNVNI